MTQSPSETLTPYAPLPVRARGTLEIFDTAFKLFRRYAGVLLAWSAVSSLINLIPIFGLFAYVFTMPLMFGAVSCAVAAAVRGQSVTFKQVWGFTKPRYGALLGVLILALILMSVVMFMVSFVGVLVIVLVGSSAANFGWFATGVTWVVGTIIGLLASSFFLAVLLGWFNLAPVIACLEDANRGSNALSRAWTLMAGNWRKACAVATILALAGGAALMIIMGFTGFFFYGGWDKFIGADTDVVSGLAFSGFSTLFFVAWTPLQAVVGAVFYLDLRTRKEALDLEWTNYAAKPEVPIGQEQGMAPSPNYPPVQSAPPPPGSGPPYAPGSTQQVPEINGPPYAPGSAMQVSPTTPTSPGYPPPPPSQVPIFAAQSPVQGQPPAPVPTSGPAPVPPVADSFAAFASQVEQEAAIQNTTTPTTESINIEKEPAPVEVGGVAPSQDVIPPVVQAVPPVQVAPVLPPEVATAPVQVTPPSPTQPPASPGVIQPQPVPPAVPSAGPTFGVRANAAAQAQEPTAPTTPVVEAPVTPPAPVVREPEPEREETSSFAPRRFRRPVSEEDDYPSSFGGGGR